MLHRNASFGLILGAAAAATAGVAACTLSTEGTKPSAAGSTGTATGTGGVGGDLGLGGFGGSGSSGGGNGTGGSSVACDAPWERMLAGSDSTRESGVALDAMGQVVLATGFKGAATIGVDQLDAGPSNDVLVVRSDGKGNPLWARSFGSSDKSKLDYATSVALDSSGSIFLTGACDSDINFGGGTIALSGGANAFIAKLDSEGGHSWSFGFEKAVGRAIAVGPGGHAVVAGHHSNTVAIAQPGDIPVDLPWSGTSDAFVMKIRGDTGAVMWSHAYGDQAAQNSSGVAIEPQMSSVYLIGSFEGSMVINPESMEALNATSEFDAFLLKLEQNGGFLWGKSFRGNKTQTGVAVATAPQDNVVITGTFEEEIVLDEATLTASGMKTDIYVARLGADGEVLWAKSFGDGEEQHTRAVAVDDQGFVYLTGAFKGTLDFEGIAITAGSKLNLFVAVLDPNGVPVDAHAFPSGHDQWGTAIAPDACGNMVLAATYDGELDLGSGPLPIDPAGHKRFLAKLVRAMP